MVKKTILLLLVISLYSVYAVSDVPFFSGNLSESSNISKGKLDKISANLGEFDYALLIGSDGTAAYIHNKAFSNVKITKSWGKWKIKAKDLPDVCNIENLSEISLFQKKSNYSLEIWDNQTKKNIITPFTARLSEFELLGKSSKNGFNVRKYKENDFFSNMMISDSFLQMSNNGMEKYFDSADSLKLEDYFFSCAGDTTTHIWINPPDIDIDHIINKIYKEKEPAFIFHIIGMTIDQWQEALSTIEDSPIENSMEPVRLTYPESSPTSSYSMRKSGDFSQLSPLIVKEQKKGQIYINAQEIMQSTSFRQALNQAKNEDVNVIFSCYELDPDQKKSKLNNKIRNLGYLIESLQKKWSGKIYIFGSKNYTFPYFKDAMSIKDYIGYWSEIK